MNELSNLPTGVVAAVEAFGNAVNVTVAKAVLSHLLAAGTRGPISIAA